MERKLIRRKGGLLMGLREIFLSTCTDRMTVYKRVFQEKEGRTVQKDLAFLVEEPCALCYGGALQKRGEALSQGDFPKIEGEARLFAKPELEIPAGCRVEVTHCGRTISFIATGEAVVYPTHQQIVLTREAMA